MVLYAWIYIVVSVFKVKILTFLYSSLWSRFTKQMPDESGSCSTVAGRGKKSYNGEMEEGINMQHKTVGKKTAKESTEPALNPLHKFLHPVII